MNKPRVLSDLAKAMGEPVGHADADMLLIETLQSLIFYRNLNPQQRDSVQKIIDGWIAKSTVSPGQRSSYQVGLFESEE